MSFVFYPELFQARADAQETLEQHGIGIFSDYSQIDLCHSSFGLELEGFRSPQVASKALQVLRRRFPGWRYTDIYYAEEMSREWVVSLSQRQF